jgi:hypothetical protein
MRRLSILSAALIGIYGGVAHADNYELFDNGSIRSGYGNGDQVFSSIWIADNVRGGLYSCNITWYLPQHSVSVGCQGNKFFESKIPPSANISTVRQINYVMPKGSSFPGDQIFQIDKYTGDAQYCVLTTEAAIRPNPNCVRINYRNAP